MKIIGISGRKQVGKDTLAKQLKILRRVLWPGLKVDHFSFASALKATIGECFPRLPREAL